MIKVGAIEALLIRKPVKNLHLAVLPPLGKVRITAPLSLKDDAIRTMIATKLSWIKKQQAKFLGQERQTEREYVSGESHYFLGKRYRLELLYEQKAPRVEIKGKTKLLLNVRPGSSVEKRAEVMTEWYRFELKKIAAKLMNKWQAKIGVMAEHTRIRRMKTRWGTCNPKARRISLNLELIKKPHSCIEYIVVHELVHLIEKKHNDRFTQLMSKYLLKWRSEKEELNRHILAHEKWTY
jgi:predicted metal-dependent hydrolase